MDVDVNFEELTKFFTKKIWKKPKRYKLDSLSRVFAQRILDPVTKSEIVAILDAMKGSGKSVSALALCEGVAKELSFAEYGDVTHWREYFDPEKNIAIITPESIHTVLKNLTKEHQVILLDDAGVSIGNRDSSMKSNKIIGKLLQTMRIKSACIIITVPAAALVDKQVRELATHYLHIEESHHAQGYNLMSCKRVWIPSTDSSKLWKIHLTAEECGASGVGAGTTSVSRWVVGRPTDETLKFYEQKRFDTAEEQLRLSQIELDKEREKAGLNPMEDSKEDKYARARDIAERYYFTDETGEVSSRSLQAKHAISKYVMDSVIKQMREEGWRKICEEK